MGRLICPRCGASHGSTAFGGDTQMTCRVCKNREQERNRTHEPSEPSKPTSSGSFGPLTTLLSKILVIPMAILLIGGPIIFIAGGTATLRNIGSSIHSAFYNVIGFFGGEEASEFAAMNEIRNASRQFTEEIPFSELPARQAAIIAFAESGASYRMGGEIKYGFSSGNTFNQIQTDIEMSYNGELDVYKFALSSRTFSGHNMLAHERFRNWHIPNGTYYIVNENGVTYVLSEVDGVKQAVNINDNSVLYDFLTRFRMGNMIMSERFLDSGDGYDGSYYQNLRRNDGAIYYRFPSIEMNYYLSYSYRLRTYKDMPVTLEHIFDIEGHRIGTQIEIDYFYDNIPEDNPTVADWR